MSEHFRYDGHVAPQVDKDCRMCVSAKAGVCTSRPSDPQHDEKTCGLCAALARAEKAKRAPRCELHGRGVAVALDEHKMLDPESQKVFDDAKATILAEVAAIPPTAKVSLHVVASRASAEQISMGAHPREIVIHYKQLDLG